MRTALRKVSSSFNKDLAEMDKENESNFKKVKIS